jgi:hypothetical protein
MKMKIAIYMYMGTDIDTGTDLKSAAEFDM